LPSFEVAKPDNRRKRCDSRGVVVKSRGFLKSAHLYARNTNNAELIARGRRLQNLTTAENDAIRAAWW
jgi:hypothetical protein